MTAMRQRIEELDRRGGLPGIELDLAELRRDHHYRARWRARNLDRTPTTDWTLSGTAPATSSVTRRRPTRQRHSKPKTHRTTGHDRVRG
jgi:hypothetical protein